MTCFYIGAAHRSGGTLLTSILCSDRTTNPTLREAHYLREMVHAYRQGKHFFNTLEDGHYSHDFEDLKQFSATWVNAFLAKIEARYSPATNLALKSFLMSVMFPAVFELLPEARFLVSVRDARDVTLLSRENLHYYFPSMTYQHPAFQKQVLFIRYEDLVQNPDSQIERILAFTDLVLEEHNPGEFWKGGGRNFDSDRKSGDPYINELYGQGVSPNRVGRYREMLTRKEIQTIEMLCAPLFSAFGYEADVA